jgi:D-alanyl-D-alanine endopeptidase (penicillin-binding protein 7)
MPGYSGFLKNQISFSLKYTGQTNATKEIYFYDNNFKKWRPLPTVVNSETGLARTRTIFPAAKVAVLEDYETDGLSAASAIVVDSSGKVIYEKNADEVRSLASLSKLMTALVFLDYNPGWDKKISMTADDNVGGASLPCTSGDSLTVKDLFYATLTGSKNNAAHALMRSTGLTEADFVNKMNEKAKNWGLKNTFFVEPTGLDKKNVSTAKEMLIISQKAFNSKDCLQATTQKWYKVSYSNFVETKITWIQNTNKLLDRDLYITGEAGYNLVSQAKNSNHELIALVLGCQNQKNYDEVYGLLKKYL